DPRAGSAPRRTGVARDPRMGGPRRTGRDHRRGRPDPLLARLDAAARRTRRGPQLSARLGGALDADRAELLLVVDLGAVLHDEAVDARELVVLRRQNHDIQLDIGQISAGKLEAGRVVGVVDVHGARQLVGYPLLERLNRLVVVVGLAWRVV